MSSHTARTDYASISDPEILDFLTTTYSTGQLGYTRKDGRPVISPARPSPPGAGSTVVTLTTPAI